VETKKERLVKVGTVEGFYESGGQMRSLGGLGRGPLHRREMADAHRRGRGALAMSARQADGSHFSDLGFLRYFIFANRKRARDHWAGARVTEVRGEVKVLLSHRNSFE
jgi:hypothetical protein